MTNPELGDIRKGREIGWVNDIAIICVECEDCHAHHWVPYKVKLKLPSHTRCRKCAGRGNLTIARKELTHIMPHMPYEESYKRKAERNHRWNQKLKQEVFSHYAIDGHVQCANPFSLHRLPVTDLDVLNIDHIHDNGAAHRRSYKEQGYGHLYDFLKKTNFPSGYQILCANCNFKKLMLSRR